MQNNADTTKWVTIQEAAEIIGLSKQRVYQLVKSGRIPALQLGRVYVIDRVVVYKFGLITRKVGRPKKADNVDDCIQKGRHNSTVSRGIMLELQHGESQRQAAAGSGVSQASTGISDVEPDPTHARAVGKGIGGGSPS